MIERRKLIQRWIGAPETGDLNDEATVVELEKDVVGLRKYLLARFFQFDQGFGIDIFNLDGDHIAVFPKVVDRVKIRKAAMGEFMG